MNLENAPHFKYLFKQNRKQACDMLKSSLKNVTHF